MENASKALIMAAGILIGILILTLMITLFASAGSLSKSYDDARKADEVQQFNVNFIKFVGRDLNIHEVVTICNFAEKHEVVITDGEKTIDNIKLDVGSYTTDPATIKKYELKINSYSEAGYIDSIEIKEK